MKILILCAMDKELNLLLDRLGDHQEEIIGKTTVYTGNLGSHEVVIAKCGIGKVNAAINTTRLIDTFNPDIVVNTGVAGGADPIMPIGAVLIADKVAYHDVWCGPGTEYGAADGFGKYIYPDAVIVDKATELNTANNEGWNIGLICSGDKFIHTSEEVEDIKREFPQALACDMESAAIAHACVLANKPFAIIRVVSDMPGSGRNVSQYENFWTEAPMKTFDSLIKIIAAI